MSEQLKLDAAAYHADREEITAGYREIGVISKIEPNDGISLGSVSMDPHSWSFILMAGRLHDARGLDITIVPPETEDATNDNGKAFVAKKDLDDANRLLGRGGTPKKSPIQKFLYRTHGLLFVQNTRHDNPVYGDFEEALSGVLPVPGVEPFSRTVRGMMIGGYMTSSVVNAARFYHQPIGSGLEQICSNSGRSYEKFYQEGHRPLNGETIGFLLDKAMEEWIQK